MMFEFDQMVFDPSLKVYHSLLIVLKFFQLIKELNIKIGLLLPFSAFEKTYQSENIPFRP